ncbi:MULTISPECIES: hypothetical protein [Kitasatospora]|uniref:Uncharacterized protein n=2 Tax=Kitasatospora TaxID=2063 RepID=A0ABT1IRK0_9ACTN|nr:hypothetical protein [Kitasatospora paracochleata]MCP2307256.1 hypothetical protein [Kitasatospora paracochleata]
MRDLFDENGVFDRVVAVVCLGLSLLMLDLGVGQFRQGGSIAWAVTGCALVLASGGETYRRFRHRR